jgi:hypothetical protein
MFLFIFQLPFLFSRSSFLLLLNSLKVNCLFHPSSNFLFFYSASAKYFDFFYGIFILIFSFSFFEFLLILQISLNYFHIYTLFFSKAFCFLLSCSKFSVSSIVFFFFLLLLTFLKFLLRSFSSIACSAVYPTFPQKFPVLFTSFFVFSFYILNPLSYVLESLLNLFYSINYIFSVLIFFYPLKSLLFLRCPFVVNNSSQKQIESL